MPLTITAAWPTLTDGKKAKASEVEEKFDWIEGSQLPMVGGEFTTSVYDIGSAAYKWKSGYFSDNIIIGTTTITSAAVNAPEVWFRMGQVGGVVTMTSSHNVGSYVINGAGDYMVIFNITFQTATSGNGGAYSPCAASEGYVQITNCSVTAISFQNRHYSSDALQIPSNLGMIISGRRA